MYTIIYIFHIIICVLLILSILLQLGQMGGFGGIFGGGGVDQIFSTSSGSMFMKKVTIVLAVLFVLTTIGLTIFSARTGLETIVR
ncbi:MAG: preprotein translocase subunit SecG [Endomicrobia bacterium]|nr:preprotein translocase subunit SecG [Endomicrobiia bacterium]MCX7940551.1 preprotein translocase subunit SecG [Endomicrobiia bacterium]MDW8056036.1 preprotein translocase subunit SecG [Elusimicrobiota bacterium]